MTAGHGDLSDPARLRICLTLYRGNMYSGGQGIYLYYLARELDLLGHDVHVVAGPPLPRLPEGVSLHEIHNHRFFEYHTKPLRDHGPGILLNPANAYELLVTRVGVFPEAISFSLRAYHYLSRLTRSGQSFDIIHDNQTLGYGTALMKTLHVPVVATIHHPLAIDRAAHLRQVSKFNHQLGAILFYPLLMHRLVQRAMDLVITDSQAASAQVQEHVGVPPDRMRVVYLGVDTEVFHPRPHVPKRANTVIFVGTTEDRKKGFFFMVQALAILRRDRDLRLIVVDKPLDELWSAPDMIDRHHVADSIEFTGRLSYEELAERYCSAEIAVVASTYEGFGLPAVEAAACGLPVVSTDGGSLPEVVADGETGIVVPARDPRSLAAGIARLLDDPDLRTRMGSAGRRRVESRFTWRRAAEGTVAVYREAMAMRRARRPR
ncbi:MAG: glycosyltransferase [Dehalococcoidia bacterium]|nr:glycosyltransferase [Dehalococcoidia bacterium]